MNDPSGHALPAPGGDHAGHRPARPGPPRPGSTGTPSRPTSGFLTPRFRDGALFALQPTPSHGPAGTADSADHAPALSTTSTATVGTRLRDKARASASRASGAILAAQAPESPRIRRPAAPRSCARRTRTCVPPAATSRSPGARHRSPTRSKRPPPPRCATPSWRAAHRDDSTVDTPRAWPPSVHAACRAEDRYCHLPRGARTHRARRASAAFPSCAPARHTTRRDHIPGAHGGSVDAPIARPPLDTRTVNNLQELLLGR